jgi:hypothetical protein
LSGRARRLSAALALLLGGAAAASACSQPTDTQPYPGACTVFEPVTWSPFPDSIGVPIDTELRIGFNGYPDPDTLGAADLLLTTGVFYYTGSYAVDLLDRAIVFRPVNRLRADLDYQMTVLPPLRSLAGCPATYQQRGFRTGEATSGVTPPAAVPFSAVQPILAAHCAGAACHRADPGDGGDGCLAGPAAGLSLCDAAAVDALVDVPSRELGSLPLVAPNDSARSYFFRKLVPAVPGGGPIPTVIGQREPPGDPLSDADLATVAGWIDSGAPR